MAKVTKNILITGANGYIGSLVVAKLVSGNFRGEEIGKIVALDLRETPKESQLPGVIYYAEDIRSDKISNIIKEHSINAVIHLACVVTPTKTMTRELMYSIDVEGTRNILKSCVENKIERVAIASSGAAYGYHHDNADWLVEEDELRGNYEFAYAYHKKIVEKELEVYRKDYPELKQFVFRIGTVLGEEVDNQITDLFKKPVVLGIKGSDTPFVFIWDEDLVNIFCESLFSKRPGVYNVAGDGAVKIQEIAKTLKKRLVLLSPLVVSNILRVLKRFKLTQYGPEQINFLRYRPVLSNKKLKTEFGVIPRKTSSEVFSYYLNTNRKHKHEQK